jgi:DNA mismatch repair protein MSH4
MCEHFLARGSYTLCATHFKRLEELAALYPNCKLWHMQVGSVKVKRSCCLPG